MAVKGDIRSENIMATLQSGRMIVAVRSTIRGATITGRFKFF